jgi:hypothetical protein
MKKYLEFINESKKEDCVGAIKNMLKKKPTIKMGKPTDSRFKDLSENYPDVKGIYSLSAMIRHLKDKGFTSNNVDAAIAVLKKDKEFDLEVINVKNYLYSGELVPHYYTDLTKSEAQEIKKELQTKSRELNKKVDKKKKK